MEARRLAIRRRLGKALTPAACAAIAGRMQANPFRPLLPLAVLVLLSACGATETAVHSAGTVPPPSRLAPPPPQLRRSQPGPLHVQNLPGLEGVIGATRSQLTQAFGTPRLDVIEGDVRKLQFSGGACVLDVYLYPREEGQEPEASYVDARRADGRDVDRATCVAALRRPATNPPATR